MGIIDFFKSYDVVSKEAEVLQDRDGRLGEPHMIVHYAYRGSGGHFKTGARPMTNREKIFYEKKPELVRKVA